METEGLKTFMYPTKPASEEEIKRRVEEMKEEQHAQKEDMNGLVE
jgi:hypothetical protein